MMRKLALALLFAFLLVGCAAKTQERRYDLRGQVKALDPAAKIATIAHEKIGDWMEAMTMEFRVKPDSEFQKLHVGDHVEGKVVVGEDNYYLTDVKATPSN
jgi:Cu/Ag efflux protein CusF